MLGSHHFFFTEKDEKRNMEDKLNKKDTEEFLKCSISAHNVPEVPKPLQVFFALMIKMLSLSIFCLRPALLEHFFQCFFPIFLVVG